MSISSKNSRHLDIGCGRIPRNPFECDELHGVDVMDIQLAGCSYKQVNVVTEKLPYTDSYFDSVSAYDFLGIIPRSAISNNTMRFPFIELMNEIYRVLKPGGRYLCLEFSKIKNSNLNFIYKNYSKLIPLIGKIIVGEKKPYEYLIESIKKFPNQNQVIDLMKKNKFKNCTYRNLSGGIVAIHSGWKI